MSDHGTPEVPHQKRKRKKKRPPPPPPPSSAAKSKLVQPAPVSAKDHIKTIFVNLLRDKYEESVQSHKEHLNDANTMDLVIKPIVKYVTGEPLTIITCLVQYSKKSLFHSIHRYVTGQVSQLHFQFAELMKLVNNNQIFRLVNNESIEFRTQCIQAFLEEIAPLEQKIACNVEIIVLLQDNIQVAILHAEYGSSNSIAAKIHGDGNFTTCMRVLISLQIMILTCARPLCNTIRIIRACIEAHSDQPFLPTPGRSQMLHPKNRAAFDVFIETVNRKCERTYWKFFNRIASQENNFGVVLMDDSEMDEIAS